MKVLFWLEVLIIILYKELLNEKIEEIKETKSENEDFLNFLFNVINPNDMEEYLAMYNSKGEAEGHD